MKVIEIFYAEENVVFNRVTGVWRRGATWEKCVRDGQHYRYIRYRTAQNDLGIDIKDALYGNADEEAEVVELELVPHLQVKKGEQ